MKLINVLSDKKPLILKKWIDLIIGNYPSSSRNLLKRDSGQFTNPVGHTLKTAIDIIYDKVIEEEGDVEKITKALDSIIRIWAVQDFEPSKVISFIYRLKTIVREEFENSSDNHVIYNELLEIENRIDDIILLSFDIYMSCREQLYEIKANEIKRNTFGLLKRAHIILDEESIESELKDMRIC